MPNEVKLFLQNSYQTLSTAGIDPDMSQDQRKTVFLMNRIFLVAAFINLFGVIFYFSESLFISALVNLTTGVIFMFGIYANYLKKYRTAKAICVANINFYILIINIAEGTECGEYFLFFPAFVALTFMIRIYHDYHELILTYLVTTVCAFSCIYLVPYDTNLQLLDKNTVNEIYNIRLVLSILLTIFISYSILNMNRKNEKVLIQAKERAEAATEMKSRFLSNMSHELRTPLNGIIGACNLLVQEKYLPEQKPSLDILRYSSEHMLKLVNDILDYTKIEAGKMELVNQPVNMIHLMEKIISQFGSQVQSKKLKFITYVDPALNMEMVTDEMRIQQILANLLSNAIKFTSNGSITLSAHKVSSNSSTAIVQFAVQDTGIGIPQNKRHKVFESFTQADLATTRKYGGTGLGLTITKDLLKLFNAELELHSEENRGTKFHFRLELPMHEGRKNYIDETPAKNLESFEGVKILVAEDNPVNLAIVKRFLTKWGIEIIEATNGKEAVEKFSMGRFDLLLLDLEMPEMDGATALREIRKQDSNIPIVAFTAAVYENIQTDLKQKGFTDFIHKPFRPEDLHGKINTLISQQRA